MCDTASARVCDMSDRGLLSHMSHIVRPRRTACARAALAPSQYSHQNEKSRLCMHCMPINTAKSSKEQVGTLMNKTPESQDHAPETLKSPRPCMWAHAVQQWCCRWVPMRRTTTSGKTLFVCVCCGRVSPTPDKHCPNDDCADAEARVLALARSHQVAEPFGSLTDESARVL